MVEFPLKTDVLYFVWAPAHDQIQCFMFCGTQPLIKFNAFCFVEPHPHTNFDSFLSWNCAHQFTVRALKLSDHNKSNVIVVESIT